MSSDDDDYYEDSEISCLDEHGWDPSVDAFLQEVIEEAPRYNNQVDFAWVSFTFIETLSPTEDQLDAALERFSPAALQVRWLYLQQARQAGLEIHEQAELSSGQCAGAAESSDAACIAVANCDDAVDAARAASAAAAPALLDAGQSAATAGSGSSRSSSNSSISAACVTGSSVPPGRDRVLHAMQNFLFGRPHDTSSDKQQSSSSDLRETVQSQGSSTTPTTASSSGANEHHAVDAAQPQMLPTAESAAEPSAEDDDRQATECAIDCSTSENESFRGCSNEALRCCLEELRWHGEALQRCASGEDADLLATEAASRRKALLWRLGLGPGGTLRGMSE